tara:strand:+ start:14 stop:247 length:234 start_codon:yes stop_codon:yes gene_type:complete
MKNTNCDECDTVIFKEYLLDQEKSCPSLPCGEYWVKSYYARGATYYHESGCDEGEAVCYNCAPNLKGDIDLSKLRIA